MNIARPDILNNYLRHIEINSYLEYLSNRYKSFVTVYTIGKSHEGREIKAIKIDLFKDKKYRKQFKENFENDIKQSYSTNTLQFKPLTETTVCNADNILNGRLTSGDDTSSVKNTKSKKRPKRKWIFIEGGTHAREWITITVALYCIHQLTEKFCRNINLLQKVRFLIIPLVNGDGYEYSHLKNRHWRKNRRPNAGSRCIGTDCNRNYDFHWENGTTSRSKCTYRGDSPFSEPETRAVKNVLERLRENLLFFISLHSCAQTIMYPWGYTKDLPETWNKLHLVVEHGRKAIQDATGRKYRCGSISQVTNRTYSGSIVDYAFGIQKVPYTIVMELPSKKFGFQPPHNKIQLIGEESWIGIKAMCQRVLEIR